MAKFFPHIDEDIKNFIEDQKIFFVATAAADGRVNLSPKGMDSFRVLGPNQILWLNLTGSGNETAAHLLKNDRMTIMMCAFEGKPNILRLFGHAKAYHENEEIYQKHIKSFNGLHGARQIIIMEVTEVQTSCGMAVPFMDFVGERDQLNKWAEKQGRDKIRNYWKEKNTKSIDGFPTDVPLYD